jgi:hypothetical protein
MRALPPSVFLPLPLWWLSVRQSVCVQSITLPSAGLQKQPLSFRHFDLRTSPVVPGCYVANLRDFPLVLNSRCKNKRKMREFDNIPWVENNFACHMNVFHFNTTCFICIRICSQERNISFLCDIISVRLSHRCVYSQLKLVWTSCRTSEPWHLKF